MTSYIGANRLAAYHESGHAVVALALGYEVETVRACPDGTGETRIPGFAWMEPDDQARIALAGTVAEEMFGHGGKFHVGTVERLLRHAEVNWDSALLLDALAQAGSEYIDHGWRLLSETAGLVMAHWGSIKLVAARLVRHGRLERDELLQIIPMDTGTLRIPLAPRPFQRLLRVTPAGSEPAAFQAKGDTVMYKSCRRSAYHESGHAVVALALGYEVETVRAGESDGQTFIPGLRSMEPNDRARVILAGALAEEQALYGGRKRERSARSLIRWTGDDLDELGFSEAVRQIGGDHGAVALRLLDEADQLVCSNWWAIERLTERLEDRNRLERNEILQVLNLSTGQRKTPETPKSTGKREHFSLSGRAIPVAELRTKADKMEADGFKEAARLMRASADRREGRRPAGASPSVADPWRATGRIAAA